MSDKPSTNSKNEPNYWLVFVIGILYIILMGVFTYYFNMPI